MENKIERVEFTQKLSKDDIVHFNYYLLGEKKNLRMNTILIGLISLVCGIISFLMDETHPYLVGDIFLFVLGLYSLFGLIPTIKLGIKLRIQKKPLIDIMKPIYVRVDSTGIFYSFEEEKNNEGLLTYSWNMIEKAVYKKNVAYVHINSASILIIKGSNPNELAKILSYFEQYLVTNIRFFKKN